MSDVGLVLLAAGGSSRMGSPKQLVEVGGRPLVRIAAEAAIASSCEPIVLVLGARAETVREAVDGLPLRVVVNSRWAEGIGTSIRAGVEAAMASGVAGVVLALADQPLVGADAFLRLVATHLATRLPIVGSRYGGTFGVPALFAAETFSRLLELEPGEGCKRLLLEAGRQAAFVACPEAEIDVDTPDDLARLAGRAARLG